MEIKPLIFVLLSWFYGTLLKRYEDHIVTEREVHFQVQ